MSLSDLGLRLNLAPIAATWAFPYTAYLLFLKFRVASVRLQNKQYLGDKLSNTPSKDGADSSGAPDPLLTATRAESNFLENVPLGFIVLGLCELNGGDKKVLNYVMATFFALRVLHVEAGLLANNTAGWGRPVGFFGSCGVLAGLSGYAGYLVKGYWGF